MPAFFDPGLLERSGVGFIRDSKVDEALHKIIGNAHITKGSYSCPSRAELRDLVWNHMDQNHRPFIHRTYDTASRIFIDGNASFSLTRFGRWPIVIPVFDGYFRENGFYQFIVLFGLIVVVNVIECTRDERGTRMEIAWAIASHRWLRFLHPLLNRRFVQLNKIQNAEDDPIRDRRVELRAAGYSFKTDAPDFVNSNVIENNTIFPPVTISASIDIHDLPEGRPVRIDAANRAFVLCRDGDSVDVWPGVCPHEGAELAAGNLSDKSITCPWHGLKFPARHLSPTSPGATVCGARLELGAGRITVAPTAA
jgi:nitrite reductase/ring-hydroxylating ferredoxin subunit